MSDTTINLAAWQPRGAPREYDAQGIIDWAAGRFAGEPSAMITAFGMEGVVLLDMVARRLPRLRVVYADTQFLFEETLRLRDRLARLYPQVTFEAAIPRLDPDAQAQQFGEALWKRDPALCCKMRKVEPLHRALKGISVVFSAIRREQTPYRRDIGIVGWDWLYQAVRVCPLATWSRRQVYEYVKERALPYNELHDRQYPAVGCTHCTTPVSGSRPWDYSREGRWPGQSLTECGLNTAGRPMVVAEAAAGGNGSAGAGSNGNGSVSGNGSASVSWNGSRQQATAS